MQLGVIGLGRMGGNIVRRLMQGGHGCVVWDRDAAAVKALADDGATGAADLKDMVARLAAPRAVWIMLPAGGPTQETVDDLAQLLGPDDTVIDGGNSFYKDDVRRAQALKAKGHQVRAVNGGAVGGYQGILFTRDPKLPEPSFDAQSAKDDRPVNGIYRAGSDHRKDGQAVGW